MSFQIKTLNNISGKGLSLLATNQYNVGDDVESPDAILLRSYNMHNMDIPDSLSAVGRAGSGVNNIPLHAMNEAGVVVFNAPGANSNAVKELVLAAMLIASRNLTMEKEYVDDLEGENSELHKAVEQGKKKFAGFELPGRTLGVVGLGAIGVKIANAARALGMHVVGYDPRIQIRYAWELSSDVKPVDSVDELLARSDFLTFHVPLIESTKNLINADSIKHMKEGAVVLNFARDGIVNDVDVCNAIDAGKLHAYVCDFPSNEIKGRKGVIAFPHLGASTTEAEENCARMVALQVSDYLENGNIINSVNLPNIKLARSGGYRLSIIHQNVPDMVGQISHVLGHADVNIQHMVNDSRGNLAYTLMDVEAAVSDETRQALLDVEGVLKVRVL
ncbi:MAG: D-3-phosphoglycerate dehydrogenase (EC [uncultured Thiotrichaceae bacterium]|uniref:D-3-phosphoglycerate dehydrogenase n=1 Tax=uncultured Thiotrichaceae bacterium TaxID=298394 RepID=A0A6S6S6G1_9GAMM|nr:MAG: D-3-phosphoglycerate dehydrogenase (EC [uncultured Thiotrichaceae bacterium]